MGNNEPILYDSSFRWLRTSKKMLELIYHTTNHIDLDLLLWILLTILATSGLSPIFTYCSQHKKNFNFKTFNLPREVQNRKFNQFHALEIKIIDLVKQFLELIARKIKKDISPLFHNYGWVRIKFCPG